MRTSHLLTAAAALAIASTSLTAHAKHQPAPTGPQPETTQPATAPVDRRLGPLPPEGPMKIVVLEAGGLAQYRTAPDQPWRAVKVGDELDEGVEFNTGPKSFIRISIGPTQQCLFDRLGTYAVNKAAVENGTIKTDTAMKYGRTRYEIETAGRTHDAVVRSSTSTLAVRGTVTELYDQPPFAPQAVSYTGRVEFRDVRRQIRMGSRDGGVVRLNTEKETPAETALSSATVDPTIGSYARTPAEQRLIEQVIAQGGIVGFDVPGGIPVITGGTPLTFDAASPNFPGEGLNFVLNWTGNADLNLTVLLPAFGDIMTPVTGLNRGKTGGITAFDYRGGDNGGFEIVFFPQTYPGSDCIDIPGPGNNPGTETYVTSIDFISGNVADVELNTYVRDPVSGQKVLVQRSAGSVNQSISDTRFAPVLTTTSFVDDAVCAPAPAAAFATTLAQAKAQANSSRDRTKAAVRSPAADSARVATAAVAAAKAASQCNCPSHAQSTQTPVKAARGRN